MAAPTVANIADARRLFLDRADRPDRFCPDCTAYLGAAGTIRHDCPGSAEAHVRATNPPSLVHD